MNKLIELNEQIASNERDLFDRRITEVELRKALEVTKLTYKSSLDTKQKEYSNDEKREMYANELPAVKQQSEDLAKYQRTTALMEIETNRKKRLFEVYLKYGVPNDGSSSETSVHS